MRIIHLIFSFSLITCLLVVSVSADTIHLVNGNVLEGQASEKGGTVEVDIGPAILVLMRSQIAKIERTGDPTQNVSLGDTYAMNGEYDSALREYQRAFQLDPNLPGIQEKIENMRRLLVTPGSDTGYTTSMGTTGSTGTSTTSTYTTTGAGPGSAGKSFTAVTPLQAAAPESQRLSVRIATTNRSLALIDSNRQFKLIDPQSKVLIETISAKEQIKIRLHSVSAGDSGAWTIQVIATTKESSARKVAKQVREESGLQVTIDTSSSIYYKVQVGQFKSRSEAASWRDQLAAMDSAYDDAWLVPADAGAAKGNIMMQVTKRRTGQVIGSFKSLIVEPVERLALVDVNGEPSGRSILLEVSPEGFINNRSYVGR